MMGQTPTRGFTTAQGSGAAYSMPQSNNSKVIKTTFLLSRIMAAGHFVFALFFFTLAFLELCSISTFSVYTLMWLFIVWAIVGIITCFAILGENYVYKMTQVDSKLPQQMQMFDFYCTTCRIKYMGTLYALAIMGILVSFYFNYEDYIPLINSRHEKDVLRIYGDKVANVVSEQPLLAYAMGHWLVIQALIIGTTVHVISTFLMWIAHVPSEMSGKNA